MQAKILGQMGIVLKVFVEGRAFAEFFPKDHLVIEQIEKNVRIGGQC